MCSFLFPTRHKYNVLSVMKLLPKGTANDCLISAESDGLQVFWYCLGFFFVCLLGWGFFGGWGGGGECSLFCFLFRFGLVWLGFFLIIA